MAFIDVFAWIVLRVLIALTVAVFVRFGMMPGRIAPARAPLGRGRNRRELRDAGLRLCVLATRSDLGLCRRAGEAGDAAMMVFKVSHVIRKVILRQVAILNYVNPF